MPQSRERSVGMNFRNRLVSVSLIAILVLPNLTGCGSGSGTPGSGNPTPTPSVPVSAITRKVQGTLNRIDRVSAAYDSIRVALRVISTLGRGRQAVGTVIAEVPVDASGNYT